MLKKLLAFSLNNAPLVLLIGAVVVVLTIYFLPNMPVDVFPELNAPRVLIMTEAGGYSAEEVEQYVTFPVESTVRGLPGVNKVRSVSSGSLSLVWVEFNWGEDLYRARQLVSERLSIAQEELPNDVHAEIAPITSITGEIMLISLRSSQESMTPRELRSLAEFELRTKLLSVGGVAQVVAIGGELPEYQVNVDPDRLRLYNLTLQDILDAASQAHSTASAGYLPNVKGLELTIRQSARVTSVKDIKDTVIRYADGAALTIGQVADVRLGAALARGTAADRGNSAVVISIQKAPGINTLTLTDDVDKMLDQIEKSLPSGVTLNRFAFRQADFINQAIHNVLITLRDASILVVIILILFLMNIRTTLITLTALPLSLAIALLVLWALGMNINVMTLGGLAVAIGELVDDAIIDVENCYKRLLENRLLPEEEQSSFLWIVYDSSNEIRSSVVFATVIIALVFLPLLFLQGLEGRFFRPLGIAYIVSILASLLVALTVTPVLCKYLLRGKLKSGDDSDSWLVIHLKKLYEPLLFFSIKHKRILLASSLVAIVLSVWLGSTFGTSFLPRFREGTYTVFVITPPGSSLPESDRLSRGIERKLATIDGVKSVIRRSGRAERDEHAEPVSTSEIDICIKEGYDQLEIRKEIEKLTKTVPGVTIMIGQPIEHRLSHVMSGTKADLAIDIYGEDLALLRSVVKEVEALVKTVPGASDVNANREVLVQTIAIKYRNEDLIRWGMTRKSAAEQVSAAFNGKVVSTINQGIKRYDLLVRLNEVNRQDINDIRHFLLRGANNQLVRLSEVAAVVPETAPYLVVREDSQRKATVSLNVASGYNLGHLVAAVQQKIDPAIHKHGLSVKYGGQFEAQQSASKMLFIMAIVVLLIILMLLNSATGSMKVALLVMVNLPLAIIGGVIAVFIAESPDVVSNFLALIGVGAARYQAPILSISSLVGYITLFGIAIRNGLLLVNRYEVLVEEEKCTVLEAVIRGSKERLTPILMTALVTVLALLPIVMAANEAGGELLAPLAIVQLGGLTTSTFLNLFVIPAGFCLLFEKSGINKSTVEIIDD